MHASSRATSSGCGSVTDVHRVVRMHFAPAHHRRLEQVEPAFHSAPPGLIAARRALISRCASMHQCFLTLYQMSAACTMLALSMSGPSGSARLRRRGVVVVDPGARRRVARRDSACAACGCGWSRRAARRYAPARSRRRDMRSLPGGVPAIRSHSIENPVNSSTVSGIARSLPQHRPLSEQKARQLAGGERGDIRNLESDHRTLEAGQRIDDGRALLRLAGQRIPHRNRLMERPVELVEHLDRQHAALAVADQHRHHAVGLVIPGQLAGELLAVGEAVARHAAVARIAQPLFRIAHRDQEFARTAPS